MHALIAEERLDFMVIQETKIGTNGFEDGGIALGGSDCEWIFQAITGNAGGMLSLWNSTMGKLIFSFSGRDFSGVCLEWGCKKTKCFVVNIYSPCNMTGKRKLWDDLRMTKSGFG